MTDKTCFVCTGKLGDILNILPIMQLEAKASGEPARLMVARDYAGILDGVSYVNPVIFEGNWFQLGEAVAEAKKTFKTVKIVQVAGPKEITNQAYKDVGVKLGDPMTESFSKEQWRVAGRLQDWRLNPPLTFDRRNPKREEELLNSLGKLNLKTVTLIHFAGATSPHPNRELIIGYLTSLPCGKYRQFLDISDIRAERFFDFLRVLEEASSLVCDDSAMLHLANAVPKLPVIAFVQDKPSLWHGSAWKPNHAMRIRYSDINKLIEIPARLNDVNRKNSLWKPAEAGPTFIHGYSLYDVPHPHLHERALIHWNRMQDENWSRVVADRMTFGRDSSTVFGDADKFPFLKDVIRIMAQCAKPQDILVLTKPDIWFRRSIEAKIMKAGLPVCGARVISNNVDVDGTAQGATDLFAFSKEWWVKHQNEFPDVIMGPDPYWHRLLAEFIVKHGGQRRLDLCYRRYAPPVPMRTGAWRELNQTHLKKFMDANGISDDKPHISQQVKSIQINPAALFRGGYNPSILPLGNGYIMAYRAHRYGDKRTNLAIAELNSSFNVRNNAWLEPLNQELSEEDPKLFYHNGSLWMSFVQSNYPKTPMKSWVLYGPLRRDDRAWSRANTFAPKPPAPQALEKNWVIHSWSEKELRCIYSSAPQHVEWTLQGDKIIDSEVRPAITWQWGEIRGGTAPVQFGGRYVRLFHSRTNYEINPPPWRYWMGAMRLEGDKWIPGTAPVVGASSKSEATAENCPHFKANIVFPGTAWVYEDNLLCSVGINDAECHVVILKESDLHL